MLKKSILTGIKPTGVPHIGNAVGAILPAIKFSQESNQSSYFFIADYHALTLIQDAQLLKKLTMEVAAAWITLGLDINKVTFFRQSKIPEICELQWILSCITPKGLMNRAHAYKAQIEKHSQLPLQEREKGINMGLYNYPVLMAADILIFNSQYVPVGKDQVQHIEIAREIARRFNQNFDNIMVEPEYIVKNKLDQIIGTDGRKMSKSYDNTIPLFIENNKLKKTISRIKTDSKLPNEPKDTSDSILFSIYKAIAKIEEVKLLESLYADGIAWSETKHIVFKRLEEFINPLREQYKDLIQNESKLLDMLKQGEKNARKVAQQKIEEVKNAIGL